MKKTETPGRIGPLEYAAGGVVGFLTLLLPLKFASLAVMPEATSFFPGYWSAYIDITWPAHSFGLFSGAALFLALAVFGWRAASPLRSPCGRTMLLWALGLPLAALPGLINCDTPDYGIWEILHLAGVGAYLWALYLVLACRPEWRKTFLWLLAAGAGLVVYSGLRQYFVGFAETREFARRQYEEGILISEILRIKLEDDRVFATFASCNVLAGYLVLVIPPVCYTLWRFGDRFEPEKVSRPLLAGIGAVFLGAVLLLTRGRGALLAAVLAAAGFMLTLPMRRLWRAGLIALAVFAIAGGAVFAHCAGRGFGSVAERVDYLKTSFTMVMEKPLAGHGWGGFFYRHMQLKTTGTDEAAHDPHNIVAAFATQAGIPAGLLVAFALLYPLAALGRRIFRKEADGFAVAIFWGEVAFLLHALMDVDLQIPACMALAGGLLIAALVTPRTADDAASAVGSKKRLLWLLPGVLLGVAALGGSWYTLRAELAYDGLMKYLQPQTPGDLELRVTPEKVERALHDAVAARPYSPFPWESAGDFYLMRRDYRSAERCFAEAQKRTMARPSTYERLSRIERVRDNRRRAGELLLEACRRFPGNPKYTDELKEHYPELEFNRK